MVLGREGVDLVALVVGHERQAHVVLAGKRALVAGPHLIQVVVDAPVGLLHRYLCPGVLGVGVYGILAGLGVVEVERRWLGKRLVAEVVVVEREAHVCRQALEERRLVAQRGRELVEARRVVVIAPDAVDGYERVGAVDACQVAVGEPQRLQRREAVGVGYGCGARVVVVRSVARHVEGHLEARSELGVELCRVVEALAPHAAVQSLVECVAKRDVVAHGLAPSAYRGGVHGRVSRLVEVVKQVVVAVDVGHVVASYGLELLVGVLLVCCCRRVVYGPVVELRKLVCRQEVRQLRGLLHVHLPRVVHPELLRALAALGLHEYHAVGGPGPVDGRGGGVLEHRDALNVVGVEV